MPCDRKRTADCQGEAEEESEYKRRMRELLETLLDRHPRIALGIDSSSGSRLGHLLRRVSAKCCRGQHAYNDNHSDGRDRAQRPFNMAIRAKKMCRHSLRVFYQNQIPARPGCRVGIGLSSFYSHNFSPRTGTFTIGISSGDNDMLACRQVATVLSALGKASYVLSIDGHDKAEIAPKICDPSNDQMSCICRRRRGPWTSLVGCAPGEDQAGTGHTDDVND